MGQLYTISLAVLLAVVIELWEEGPFEKITSALRTEKTLCCPLSSPWALSGRGQADKTQPAPQHVRGDMHGSGTALSMQELRLSHLSQGLGALQSS